MSDQMSLDRFFRGALAEDIGSGDVTTLALLNRKHQSRAYVIAKQKGVVSGGETAARIFNLLDPDLQIRLLVEEGDRLLDGEKVMEISGKTGSILSAERTALNFIGHLSGIATLTSMFTEAVSPLPVAITDTRKTTPLWRRLEKQAVRAGGGVNHRQGLFDMVLIKENHIEAAGGISQAVNQCRAFLKNHRRDLKIEIEARNLDDVRACLSAKPDRIMLDNMDVEMMAEAVRIIDGRAEVEASGSVSLQTVRAIAACGVDYISIGALTHSVPCFDFSLLLEGR
jgi:nicotinate-nucleotide pyrophosphorylase (carboxylating)